MAYRDVIVVDHPIAYWRLGETSGPTAVDAVSYRHGTYQGSVKLGKPGALVGDPDASVAFDGAGYVAVGPWTALNGATALSVDLWFKIPSGTNSSKYLVWRDSQLDIRARENALTFGLVASGYSVFTPNTTVIADVWHHLACIYDGSNLAVYLDGAPVGSTPKSGTVGNGIGNLNLAGFLNAGSLVGGLDEVAIYNYALTEGQIAAHYHAGAIQILVDSERAAIMQGYLPPYYANSRVIRSILQAQGTELDWLRAAISELLDQAFVTTASWRLDDWETELALTPAPSYTNAERRARIIAKLRGIGTATIFVVKGVAESFDHGQVVVIEDHAASTVNIRFVSETGIPAHLADVQAALRAVVPAHLDLSYEFDYFVWSELDAQNWQWSNLDGLTMTWEQLQSYA